MPIQIEPSIWTFDLFMELGANDEQLDFSYIYASGFNGYAIDKIGDTPKDLTPLFEFILKQPPLPGNLELPFLMQAATLTYDDYIGRQASGRILEGKIKKAIRLSASTATATTQPSDHQD